MPRYNRKITRTMSEEFFLRHRANVPTTQYKAFTHLLYLTGCRVSELLPVKGDSLKRQDEYMVLYVRQLKKYYRKSKDKKTMEKIAQVTAYLDYPLPFVPYIVEYFQTHERPFPFTRQTAWNICKRYYGVYPHYFRLNRLTFIADHLGVAHMLDWANINMKSADHYLAKKRKQEVTKLMGTTR